MMSSQITSSIEPIVYPDDDGEPMSDNTRQYEWMHLLKGNFDLQFADRDDVFVAGNLLWYPTEGNPAERLAPDVLIVFGRAKGYRGSYQQWLEGGVAPQVVFEVLSPSNSKVEMRRKRAFYDRHGVREYYVLDPDEQTLRVYLRGPDGQLTSMGKVKRFISPMLGTQFDASGDEIAIHFPDGNRFLTFAEKGKEVTEAKRQANAAKRDADAAKRDADAAKREADAARQQAERLLNRLRALGIDPES